MNFKYKLVVLLLMILFYACDDLEEDINLYYDIYQPKLAVFGFISNTEGVQLQVLKTVPPDSPTLTETVQGLTVWLYEDNEKMCQLVETGTNYFQLPEGYEIKYNHDYYITAHANGMPKIQSEPQRLPQLVEIDSLSVMNDTINQTGKFLTFYFTHSTINKYYYFSAEIYDVNNNRIDFEDESRDIFGPYAVVNAITFADKNSVFSIPLIYDDYDYQYDTIVITAKLFNLTEAIGKYAESVIEYEATLDDPLCEQPYPIFSNIDGGFGIWGAYSETKRQINFILNNKN